MARRGRARRLAHGVRGSVSPKTTYPGIVLDIHRMVLWEQSAGRRR